MSSSEIRTGMNPEFYYRHEDILSSDEQLKKHFDQVFRIANLTNAWEKVCLEIGCGYGLTSVCLSLLGAKKVIALDMNEEMIKGCHKLFAVANELELPVKVRPELGDILSLPIREDSIDCVVLIEAISHIRDTELLLENIQRLLKPNGVLYIEDGNNSLYLPDRRWVRTKWKEWEYGPIREGQRLVHERSSDYGSQDYRIPFLAARVNILEKSYPALDTKTIYAIAKKTRGMWGDQIIEAADEYLTRGIVTRKADFPRNPFTGEYQEKAFNPLLLKRTLSRYGFESRLVYQPWVKSGSGIVAWFKNRVKDILNREFMLPFFRHGFTILAVKRHK